MSLFCAIVAARLSLTNRDVGNWGLMAVAGAWLDLLLAIAIFGDPSCR